MKGGGPQELRPNCQGSVGIVIKMATWCSGVKDSNPDPAGLEMQGNQVFFGLRVGVGDTHKPKSRNKSVMMSREVTWQGEVIQKLSGYARLACKLIYMFTHIYFVNAVVK